MPVNIDVEGGRDEPNANTTFGAISTIADSLAGILQPYKRQELALRAAMTADPSLAQKLADLEAKSPGSIGAFAGPNAERFFKNMVTPSPEAQGEIRSRPALEARLKDKPTLDYIATQGATGQAGGTPGAVAQSALTEDISHRTQTALAENAGLAENAVARRATGSLAGTGEKQLAQARYLQSVPKLNELQARGVLQTEFQKFLNGQQSEFTGDMLNAAMDLPMQKALLIPYLEAQKNARARELASTRFELGDRGYAKSMDSIILANAARAYGSSKTNALIGDFVKLFGGSEELIAQQGGSSEQGVVAARQAMDVNAENKDNDLAILKTINNTIKSFDDAKSDGGKQAALSNLKELGVKMSTPVYYDMDRKGNLVTLNGRWTTNAFGVPVFTPGQVNPTQENPTRNPGNTAVPQSAPTSGKQTGGSRTVSGSTRTSTSVAAQEAAKAAAHKKNYDEALAKAPKHTAEVIKGSGLYQSLTEAEQKVVLSKAKKE